MTRLVTWLHLSDLHAGDPTSWEASQIKDTLVDDLRLLQSEHGLNPDFIVFTGDVAYGQPAAASHQKMPSQYDLAQQFFDAVRNAIAGGAIPKENIFIVPGNHDVNRSKVVDYDTDYLDSQRDVYKVADMMEKKDEKWKRFSSRLNE